MSPVQATYYDGQSTRAHRASLSASESGLVIHLQGQTVYLNRDEFDVMEPSGKAPRKILISKGGELEVPQQEGLSVFLSAIKHRDSWVVSMQGNLKWALLSTFFIVFLGVAFYLYGLPVISKTLAHQIPAHTLEQIDENSFGALDERVFKPSRLSASKQQEIRNQFAQFLDRVRLASSPPIPQTLQYRIEFRSLKGVPNAMAWPGGTIVLLDDLTKELTDPEIMAVLAHEVAHVIHRHAAVQLIRSSFIGVAFAFTVGDFSVLGGSVLLGLGDLAMTREMEREADEFSVRAFAAAGEGLEPLLNVHDKLIKLSKGSGSEDSAWTDYFKSHPSGQARKAEMKAIWRSLSTDRP
ncbi:MAG: M48 family metallopeptidase [Limnobacter sp.]|nr:M48 family metallopeptidase [Limnobacter sp.]